MKKKKHPFTLNNESAIQRPDSTHHLDDLIRNVAAVLKAAHSASGEFSRGDFSALCSAPLCSGETLQSPSTVGSPTTAMTRTYTKKCSTARVCA